MLISMRITLSAPGRFTPEHQQFRLFGVPNIDCGTNVFRHEVDVDDLHFPSPVDWRRRADGWITMGTLPPPNVKLIVATICWTNARLCKSWLLYLFLKGSLLPPCHLICCRGSHDPPTELTLLIRPLHTHGAFSRPKTDENHDIKMSVTKRPDPKNEGAAVSRSVTR